MTFPPNTSHNADRERDIAPRIYTDSSAVLCTRGAASAVRAPGRARAQSVERAAVRPSGHTTAHTDLHTSTQLRRRPRNVAATRHPPRARRRRGDRLGPRALRSELARCRWTHRSPARTRRAGAHSYDCMHATDTTTRSHALKSTLRVGPSIGYRMLATITRRGSRGRAGAPRRASS